MWFIYSKYNFLFLQANTGQADPVNFIIAGLLIVATIIFIYLIRKYGKFTQDSIENEQNLVEEQLSSIQQNQIQPLSENIRALESTVKMQSKLISDLETKLVGFQSLITPVKQQLQELENKFAEPVSTTENSNGMSSQQDLTLQIAALEKNLSTGLLFDLFFELAGDEHNHYDIQNIGGEGWNIIKSAEEKYLINTSGITCYTSKTPIKSHIFHPSFSSNSNPGPGDKLLIILPVENPSDAEDGFFSLPDNPENVSLLFRETDEKSLAKFIEIRGRHIPENSFAKKMKVIRPGELTRRSNGWEITKRMEIHYLA